MDTFAASAALDLMVEQRRLQRSTVDHIKKIGSEIACDLLSGKTVLTVDDAGNYVEVVLAEEPATGDQK